MFMEPTRYVARKIVFGQVDHGHGYEHAEFASAIQAVPRSRMSEWQPIKTAPRDGTRIILYQAGEGVDFAVWEDTSYETWERISETQKELVSITEGHWESSILSMWAPTHWMPRPKPPKD